MSEENTAKITSVVKTKDPRRVEAGKRLAAISKEAKKKKKADASYTSYASETADTPAESSTDLKEIGLTVSVVGILVGVVGLYYRFGKKTECENDSTVANTCPDEEQDEKRETKTTSVDEEPKFKTNTKTKLDSLD